MTVSVDREGIFRGTIVEYGLREADSGAVAVSIKAQLTEFFDGENGWVDWSQYDVEAYGSVWVIKTDKSINKRAADSLVQHAGWDGTFTSINQGTWHPTPCQFTVKCEPANEYHAEDRYSIAFVNDFDRTPGGNLGNVDESRAKSLESQYGSQMRALFSNAKRGAAKPEGSKPKSPPGPSQQRAAAAAQKANGEEIPF